MHISRLLARNAPIAPGNVELMIHQVVETFQNSIAKYTHRKKLLLLMPCISIQNNGMNAKKIRKVSGEIGQAAKSNMPERRERMPGCIFFNWVNFYFKFQEPRSKIQIMRTKIEIRKSNKKSRNVNPKRKNMKTLNL